ncbi:MAG: dihydrodipicolinate synthase family protein [Tepidisphaeraceae bacterium]
MALNKGVVIPASPLALDRNRRLDERRQRALWRYYLAAGAGGIAVGVHTTQFAIRDANVGLFEPLLSLAREEFDRAEQGDRSAKGERRACKKDDRQERKTDDRQECPSYRPAARVGGIIGSMAQAVREATLLRDHGFHAGLLGLGALREASDDQLISHCMVVAEIIPVMGFYLQPAAGGRLLPYSFWRRFAEIENVVAIKIAPFNRYQTVDVVRAVVESGRDDIALYTGNDDNIMPDLVTPFAFDCGGRLVERRIVGGLLGHWAVWTRTAVEQLGMCHIASEASKLSNEATKRDPSRTQGGLRDDTAGAAGDERPRSLGEILALGTQVTDANAAIFDVAHGFAGCIAGIHEVLRRQGLLEGIRLLDEREGLSPGQAQEIDRVYRAYPHLNDDVFVAEHLDEWMK